MFSGASEEESSSTGSDTSSQNGSHAIGNFHFAKGLPMFINNASPYSDDSFDVKLKKRPNNLEGIDSNYLNVKTELNSEVQAIRL